MALPERLPGNSCDAHLHVFGDPKAYPVAHPNALYQPPPDCTFDASELSAEAFFPVSMTIVNGPL